MASIVRLVILLSLLLALGGASPLQSWNDNDNAGHVLILKRQWAEAEIAYRKAVKAATTAKEQARSRNGLADALRGQGRYAEAESEYLLSLKLLREAHALSSPEEAMANYGLARVAWAGRQMESADSLFALAKRQGEASGQLRQASQARTLWMYGSFEAQQHNYGSSKALMDRAIALLETERGDERRILLWALLERADLALAMEDTSAALAYAGRSVNEGSAFLSGADLDLAVCRSRAGAILGIGSQFALAKACLEQSLDVLDASEQSDVSLRIDTRIHLGNVLVGTNQLAGAKSYFLEALDLKRSSPDAASRYDLSSLEEYVKGMESALASQAGGASILYEDRYVEGAHFQIGSAGDLQVWIAAWMGDEIEALVYVVNGSGSSITFNPEQILLESISGSNGQEKRVVVKTFTARQWEAKASNERTWNVVLASIAASLSNTPQPSTTQVSGRVNNGYGASSTYYGTITSWPSQRDYAEANARTQAQVSLMSDRLTESYNAMRQSLMRIHTLEPNSYYGGKVYMNKKGKRYVATVPYGGIEFKFNLNWK